ncbi:IS630-like element ISHwa7 family transposase [Haloquadratum walsbyi]|uniref:ISH16-type transposase ISHwa7 n=1 Tax=Haloquadratum walsbyi (strain DSM 16854 / JCM 12705 / C23) TaxID=768065 RepID=G0LMM3_HALWC|nr:IS630-like element ISHwa7 family transposase [Haloquadratum walsbyi]CCC41343.1 ISH16-type transposase ISHwa7 [Haloquadratum walsbyi C23]
MTGGRRKEITHHLSEKKIDELLREATDDRRKERLGFLKNLYYGDLIAEAADREGRSAATGRRWADAWNEGGLEGLMPSFGGGRPPKLDEDEQEELLEMLRDGQPWKSQEIQHLLKEEFDVEYHPDYLGKVLRELGLSYAKPRPKRPYRPENPEEILDERVGDALDEDETPHNREEGDDEEGWTVDDDVCTDGGTVLGFFDASQPQPYDNSRRVWYVDDPHVERPLVKTEESAVGFYALNGESMVRWKETEKKERICEVLEAVREQNPGQRILLVLDKHGSHVCEYTRKRAHQLGIDLIFLPSGSPHLNPIEQVWKYLKWTTAPIIVEDEDEFHELVRDVFDQVTQRISFAKDWCQKFLDLQKFP